MNAQRNSSWSALTSGVALTLLLVCGVAHPAKAGLIHDNGSPIVYADEMTDWIQADDFNLSSPTNSFDTIRFWSVENSTAFKGSIYWSIYRDAGSTPGTALYQGEASSVSRIATGRKTGTLAEFDNTFSIGNVNLSGGTYWLGLHNGPLTNTGFQSYYWSASNLTGNAQANRRPFGDNIFTPNGVERAFQLSQSEVAPVPELNTMTLVVVAMAGMIPMAWLRKKRNPVVTRANL